MPSKLVLEKMAKSLLRGYNLTSLRSAKPINIIFLDMKHENFEDPTI
jgi:hypothetical protein